MSVFTFVQTCLKLNFCLLTLFFCLPFFFVFSTTFIGVFWYKGRTVHKCMYWFTCTTFYTYGSQPLLRQVSILLVMHRYRVFFIYFKFCIHMVNLAVSRCPRKKMRWLSKSSTGYWRPPPTLATSWTSTSSITSLFLWDKPWKWSFSECDPTRLA